MVDEIYNPHLTVYRISFPTNPLGKLGVFSCFFKGLVRFMLQVRELQYKRVLRRPSCDGFLNPTFL